MHAGNYQLDRFKLDPGRQTLRADGNELAATPPAYDLPHGDHLAWR